MTVSLAHVTFDCANAAQLASFWSAALGRPVDEGASIHFASIGYPGYLEAPGARPPTEGPAWLFVQVPEGKSAKNRMHVDVEVDSESDRETEVQRLIGLGAERTADHDAWGHQWIVMRDPEGNEFCVS